MTTREDILLTGDYADARCLYERSDPRCLVFDLRSRGVRKLWQEVAYVPRIDTGEETTLRDGCHETSELGWME